MAAYEPQDLLIKEVRDENFDARVGLDCFDGTPVLDLKPYREDYRADQYDLAEWYRGLRTKAGGDI